MEASAKRLRLMGPSPEEPAGHVVPLTERIVARLPGSGLVWKLIWAVGPPSAYFYALPLALRALGRRTLIDSAAYSIPYAVPVFVYAVALALWAAPYLARRAARLGTMMQRVVGPTALSEGLVSGMGSVLAPLIGTAVFTLLSMTATAIVVDPLAAVLSLPFQIAVNLPLITALWICVALLRGLRRLGGERLRLAPFPEDRMLGLRPLGSLAVVAFCIMSAGFLPIIAVSLSAPWALALDLVLYAAVIVAFLAVLTGLHRQMRRARETYLQQARSLYAAAYEPLAVSASEELLRRQAPLLSAAEALERRAESVSTWPFDAPLGVTLAAVATSVTSIIVSRFVLIGLGL